MSSKGEIKRYWEEKLPQVWYSDKKDSSLAWSNELIEKRYSKYYPYIPAITEFNEHNTEKVLECGVGVGTDLLMYGRGGADCYGIDLTQSAIDTTKKRFKLHNLEERLKFIQTMDAENLKFENDYFDLVYSFGVLHHTPDTQKGINEIYRVLKPGGKAIIMLYANGWRHYIDRLFWHGIIRGDIFRYGYQGSLNKNTETYGNSPLTRVYRKRQVKALFKEYRIESVTKHRLGEHFDYRPWENKNVWYLTWKFPERIVQLCKKINLESIIGENWIIKAVKE